MATVEALAAAMAEPVVRAAVAATMGPATVALVVKAESLQVVPVLPVLLAATVVVRVAITGTENLAVRWMVARWLVARWLATVQDPAFPVAPLDVVTVAAKGQLSPATHSA